ncbi:hypothetical protein GEMRC1_003174 [Eukaryota sp. GEM-RC1]
MGVALLSSFLQSQKKLLRSFDFNKVQEEPVLITVDSANFCCDCVASFAHEWYYGISLPSFYHSIQELFEQLKSRNIIFHFFLESSSLQSLEEKLSEHEIRANESIDSITYVQSCLNDGSIPHKSNSLLQNSLLTSLIIKCAVAAGFHFSIARGEGDQYMANNCKERNSFGVLSGDSDFAIFPDCTWILSNTLKGSWSALLTSLKSNLSHTISYVSSSTFRDHFKINLTDFATIAGCDFSKHVIADVNHTIYTKRGKSRVQAIIDQLKAHKSLEETPLYQHVVAVKPEIEEARQLCKSFYSLSEINVWNLIDFDHELAGHLDVFAVDLKMKLSENRIVLHPSLAIKNQISLQSFSIELMTRDLLFAEFCSYRRICEGSIVPFEVLLCGQLEPNEEFSIISNYLIDIDSYSMSSIDVNTPKLPFVHKLRLLFELSLLCSSGSSLPSSPPLLFQDALSEQLILVNNRYPGLLLLVPVVRFIVEKTMIGENRDQCSFISVFDVVLIALVTCYHYFHREADDLIGVNDDLPSLIDRKLPCFQSVFMSELLKTTVGRIMQISTLFEINEALEILPNLNLEIFASLSSVTKSQALNLTSFSEIYDFLLDLFKSNCANVSECSDDLKNLTSLVFHLSVGDLYSSGTLSWTAEEPQSVPTVDLFLPFTPRESTTSKLSHKAWRAIDKLNNLPIFQKQSVLIDTIANNRVTLVTGQTGSGKTTILPLLLLAMYPGKKIVVTQPRRIAAISMAQRLSSLLGTPVGDLVGYRIGGESKVSSNTLIELQTIGYAFQCLCHVTHKCMKVDFWIIDEIHERSIDCDCVSTLIRRMLSRVMSARLVVTSATLQVDLFTEYFQILNFGKVPTVHGGSTLYPVDIYHVDEFAKYPPLKSLAKTAGKSKSDRLMVDCDLIVGIILSLARPDETILVFLPGIFEIEQLFESLNSTPFPVPFEVSVIFSLLSSADQKTALLPPSSGTAKVVLSTDIAESSLTVQGVTVVIDSGLHKRLSYEQGRLSLNLMKAGKSCCTQRTGRAGRLSRGVCIRLFSSSDFEKRDHHTAPEILTCPLNKVLLDVKTTVPGRPSSFLMELPQSPSQATLRHAITSLYHDRALFEDDEMSGLTYFGTLAQLLPIDADLCRIIQVGLMTDDVLSSIIMVALITCKDIFFVPATFYTTASTFFTRRLSLMTERLRFASNSSDVIVMFRALLISVAGESNTVFWKELE